MSKKNESETSPQNGSSGAPQDSGMPQGQEMAPPELASLMQVREILTGPLASDVEQRIAEMDRRLEESVKELTENSTKRLDAMKKNHKEELGKFRAELEDQRSQYRDRFERLERELSLGLEQVRGHIQDVTDDVATTTEALRGELATEFDAIRGTIQGLFEKITENAEEEKHRLREELVDRDTLSAALSEVAIRLAPAAGGHHEVDPSQPDIEIDQILDGATAGQV